MLSMLTGVSLYHRRFPRDARTPRRPPRRRSPARRTTLAARSARRPARACSVPGRRRASVWTYVFVRLSVVPGAVNRPHDRSDPTGDCSTSDSFDDHGIPRGRTPISRTYDRLAAGSEPRFEPTVAFFDRLESAFILGVPGHRRGVRRPRARQVRDRRRQGPHRGGVRGPTRRRLPDRRTPDVRTQSCSRSRNDSQ